MGEPKKATSANTGSTGFSAKLVTITAITPDGQTAIAVDKAGVEVRVPMGIQRSKGILPAAGETWIVSQDITTGWTFSAIAATDSTPFVNPATATAGGSGIPGSAIVPGSVPGSALAPQSITGLNLAAAASGTNLILDPAFTIIAINATRKVDPGTHGTWSLVAPNATASGAALATLALMPSALVPLYVTPGEQYYISVGVTLSGGSGVVAGIQFAFNDGSFLGPDLPVAAGPNTVAQLVTIPAGVHTAYMRLIVSGLSGTSTAVFTNPVLYITAGPNQLQAGSVTNAAIALGAVTADSLAAASVTANAIAANSVDASKIVANTITAAQLAAGIVYAGIVNGTVIEGSFFLGGTGGGVNWRNAVPTTPGYFLYYDDGIANPVIVFAVTADPGSDQWGNTWPGGAQFTGLSTSTNLLSVVSGAGDTLLGIDNGGNIAGQTVSAGVDVLVGGSSVSGLISEAPLGLVNYGFKAIGGTAWPSPAIGATEIALFELDQQLTGGRVYEVEMDSTIINAAAAGSMHMHLRWTTDGSTPTTSSSEARQIASRVETGSTDAHMGPIKCVFTPGADALYRFLFTGHAGASTWQFKNDEYIRVKIYDLGTIANPAPNNLFVLGSGTSGGASGQAYTKTYRCSGSASYYGSNASGGNPQNGARSFNSTCYQGQNVAGAAGGDQYSFALFPHATIASDLSGATINSVKIKLTSLGSYYSWGHHVILGYTTYGGSFGSTFIPGAGTTEDVLNFDIGQAQTLTYDITGTSIAANLVSGAATAVIFGPGASFTTAGDHSNYGLIFGYAATDNRTPQLIINYTK